MGKGCLHASLGLWSRPCTQEGAKTQRGSLTAERLWVRVGFRGLSPRVREPGAGLGVEGSFLSGQIFPKYKSDHISPLLKNTPGPSTVYRKMATFPAAVQALHQVTHPQILSPLPSQGLPSLWGGRGAPQPDRKMGGGFWEGQGPTGAFGCSRGSCLRPAPTQQGAGYHSPDFLPRECFMF